MPESSFSNTCSLLPNTHHSLIELRTRDSTSALHLRAILSSESINKKHKDAKQEALNRPWKGYFLLYKSWNTQFECSSGLPWGRAHQVTPIFQHCTCLQNTTAALHVWIRGWQIHFREEANSQKESTNNNDRLYLKHTGNY